MLAGIWTYVRHHHLAFLALFIALGGTAWAIEANSVKSKHIVDDKVRGVDVDEATLENVDAASVGGLQVRKINFDVPDDDVSPYASVLSLGGLEITAACRTFGDGLDVKATTTKDNAKLILTSISASVQDDTSAGSFGDFDSNHPAAEIDNLFTNHFITTGTLHYQAPDGSVVVADLMLYDGVGDGCDITGMAIGA